MCSATGWPIVPVEQNSRIALESSLRTYLIEAGTIKHEAASAALARDDATRPRCLGV